MTSHPDVFHRPIVLIGHPNVGKSLLFNRLTGGAAIVSNYPGTTVEIERGKLRLGERLYEVVDTPGLYHLVPNSEDERVARSILLSENPFLVLHVVDAKNLERMLPLTFQLLEAAIPVILVLNMMDEAEKLGLEFNLSALEKELGVPVVGAVSTSARGLTDLRHKMASWADWCAVNP